MERRLNNYLRTYRRRWALSQDELAILVGYKSAGEICRIERQKRPPKLETVIACQVLFGTPVDELFPALFGDIEEEVIRRVYELSEKLDKRSNPSAATTRKLVQEIFSRIESRSSTHEI